jgi:prepilin-type N-terminal cleavage/methylation domain-containing protein
MQNDYRAIERRPAPPSPGPFAAEDPAGPDALDAFGEVAPATGPPATRNPLKLAWRALRQGARRGMTIIEIMVVMGIIAIIGTAIAFGAIEIFGQN